MTNYKIERATKEHLVPLAAILRPSDQQEVWAMHRFTPYEALVAALDFSDQAWTGFLEERPVLMWGVGSVGVAGSGMGAPWLLSSGEAERQIPIIYLRYYRRFVDLMQRRFRLLENHVHGANGPAMKWLRWGGFTIESRPEIINGEIFYHFWRES